MSDFFDIPAKTAKVKVWPTLYARTSTGAVQVWWVEQENDRFRSISGQKDGAKITADWTIAKPKNVGRANATTAIQQAEAEIQSKYDKQLKSGGYWTNEAYIDEDKFFQVMLAKSFDDYRAKIDWAKGVGVQIKYNGGRVVATRHGLFSRKGERYISIPHIEESLKPFFLKFPDAVLDGEGFNYDLREKLNQIMKLLRKTVHVTADDLKKSKEMIRFYIYDGYGFPATKDGEIVKQTDCYLKRKAAIDNAFFAPCFKERYKDIIGAVPTWVVKSEKELEDLYQKFLDDKQEGAILRILGEGYQNKRSKFLLKYKPYQDAEFTVLSVQEGVGKFAGRISTFTITDGTKYSDGTTSFDATFAGPDDVAVQLWVTDEYQKEFIGKKLTFRYNGLTGFGKPNYCRLIWDNYLNDK